MQKTIRNRKSQRESSRLFAARQTAKKLPDGDDSDSAPAQSFDQIQIPFEIIVSSDQVLRFSTDGRLQDLVIIGVAAYPQLTESLHYIGACRDQPNK
ncbi:MAG: hypothetical protein A3F90_09110 [Deltaproteobacteria bacterium RIFCSPLOWO2_12_FULL_60_19]|nr:MAG: hypothetical protein A3F90_09110 [Deltaproteobacteria bacterium RIFCSPLOWO2_12_FULL_60_19]